LGGYQRFWEEIHLQHSGKLTLATENGPFEDAFPIEVGDISIAMLVYQRVRGKKSYRRLAVSCGIVERFHSFESFRSDDIGMKTGCFFVFVFSPRAS